MIDYYETKSQPINRKRVAEAYNYVRANKGSAGIDGESLSAFQDSLSGNLYKIWNRLTSGSYFPPAVMEVAIPKKDGGRRKLGIPTVSDRIAQTVVKQHLEPKVDKSFHDDSYGYRPKKNAHQALEKARFRCNGQSWVVNIDIKGYFDTIDHELLMKAVRCYTKEQWVLMYIERWLKAPTCKPNGELEKRDKGTPQGGCISPLLSNIFLHFVFDKWMEINYESIKFERFADDIIVHCCSEEQAKFILNKINERMNACKLSLHPTKTKLVYCKNYKHQEKHKHNSFDFLGYTFKPSWCKTKKHGFKLLMNLSISQSSESKILDEIRKLRLHKWTGKLQELVRLLNPKIRGWLNYYGKFSIRAMNKIWYILNKRLIKWVKWNKGYFVYRSLRWLRRIYARQQNFFVHWSYVKP